MTFTMSSCRIASLTESPLVRHSVLGLLVSMMVVVAGVSVSGGDAGQKVATALEEMSLVVGLLLLHLAISKFRGDKTPKSPKKKKVVSEDVDGATPTAGDAAEEVPGDDEGRQVAIGKITTKIRAAVKAGDMAAAEALMESMREVGGQPGRLRRACWSVAFGEIVNGYVRDGNGAKAGEWLGHFAACAPTIRPSTACANAVITTICASGDAASAEAWVQKMPQVGIRVDEETFSNLIHGCVRVGDVSRGIHWLREMRKAGLRPSAELNKLVLQACSDSRQGVTE